MNHYIYALMHVTNRGRERIERRLNVPVSKATTIPTAAHSTTPNPNLSKLQRGTRKPDLKVIQNSTCIRANRVIMSFRVVPCRVAIPIFRLISQIVPCAGRPLLVHPLWPSTLPATCNTPSSTNTDRLTTAASTNRKQERARDEMTDERVKLKSEKGRSKQANRKRRSKTCRNYIPKKSVQFQNQKSRDGMGSQRIACHE